MPLGRKIQKIIAEAGYNNAETIRKCEDLGVKIDKSTFSKIVTGKIKEPNIQTLNAIAKVCNVDVNKLLIEIDFDKSPKRIQEILFDLKFKISKLTKNYIENEFEKPIGKEFRKEIEKQPISDFLIYLSNFDERDFELKNIYVKESNKEVEKILNNTFQNLRFSIGIPVNDNGMNPIVPKDSTVTIEIKSKYEANDIVLVKIIKSEKLIARYIKLENNKIYLYPINKKYEVQEYKENEIILLGKISTVTNKI